MTCGQHLSGKLHFYGVLQRQGSPTHGLLIQSASCCTTQWALPLIVATRHFQYLSHYFGSGCAVHFSTLITSRHLPLYPEAHLPPTETTREVSHVSACQLLTQLDIRFKYMFLGSHAMLQCNKYELHLHELASFSYSPKTLGLLA